MAVATGSNPVLPRTLAAVALPPRVRRVLENLQQTAATELGRQLQVVLHEAELELVRLAEHSRGNQVQSAYAASLRSLRQHASELIPQFMQELEAGLAQLHAPRSSRRLEELALPSHGLRLVDDSEMDEGSVLGDMAARSDSRNSLALQLMGQRFGVLAGTAAFDAEHLPLGPHALCHALRTAGDHVALALDVRLLVYKQFDKVAMAHFPALLETLNARLVDAGILPHLSFVPVRTRPATPGLAREAEAPASPAAPPEPATPAPAPPASQPAAEAAAPAPAGNGFAGLQNLLARRRMLLEKLRPGSTDERVRKALALSEVLGALRRMRTIPGKHGTPASIRQTLLAQARQLHGHGVTLDETDSDGFELFGLFHGQLQRELRNGSPGEALVERLTLPLLQLALRDQRFFIDPAHPARALLDAVSLAGARWLAEDDLDPQWLGLLQRAVSTVQEDPDAGDDTFVAANHALQGGLHAAARKNEMAERRHVEAACGREKLELARLRASSEIAHLVAGRPLPRFHGMLLEQAWTDVLSLVLLRSGEASEAWREMRDATMAIVDASTGGGEQPPDPAFLGKLQDALAQVGYHPEDAGAIARQLANGRAEDADLASRTELVLQLKARTRLGEDTLARVGSTLPPRNDAEQAAYARLGALGDGCWVDLHDPTQGSVVRRRLAWTSARTRHALLLNRRSMRSDGEDLDGLARRLAAGRLQLVEQDVYPAELAWQATLANLHRIAGDPAGHQEAAHEQ